MLTKTQLREMEAILDKERVLTSREDLLSYAYDAYVKEFLPDAVLFPRTPEEISRIMKLAGTERIFVTPQGSGHGAWCRRPRQTGGCRPLLYEDESNSGDQ